MSRRWLLFFLTVLFLTWLAWRLGEWQFGRLDQRRADNAVIKTNESLAPAEVTSILAVGEPVAETEEWRLVTATGTYVPEDTIVVRYRTREHQSGIEVVVPLELPSGQSVLVDRGWMAVPNQGDAEFDVPLPPTGEVTVTGWVRADDEGSATEVRDQSSRSINSTKIGAALHREVLGGFVALDSEDPEPAQALAPVELPELNEGPHFFYGLQWWFFGALAIFGFFYLMYDEARGGPDGANGRTRRKREKKPRQSNHPSARRPASE